MSATMLTVPALVAGRPLEPAEGLIDHDPSTGRPWAEVARCGAAEVDLAVAAAREAFESGWRQTSAAERGRVLGTLAALIRRDAERLAELESRDVGKPLTQARADAELSARYYEFYAGAAEALHGDTLPSGAGMLAFTLREPHGVTAHITPWNYPMQMAGRTLAPALAAGNCCVLKPAEDTPVTALEIARLALEAGLPPGVLNVVPGLGGEAGAALAAHPGIDHVAFTGSRETGTLVARAAAEHVVPVTLELGGKSPNVVFADADLESAVPQIAGAILQNAGQTCSAGSRLLVDERVHDEVVAALAARFASLSIGPAVEDPDLGPLINERQRERVAGYVERGRAEGELVVGGGVPGDERLAGGYFFQATLFDRVRPDAAIAREEIFGPVLVTLAFRDEAEAISLANGTDYGLVAGLWTSDVGRAARLARTLDVGQVFVNQYGAGGGVELPFGGCKRSGYGREKGFEGLLGYTRTKTVAIGV